MFMRNLSGFFRKHPYLLLFLLISATGAAAYYQYIFGGSLFMFRDIGSDTAEQYIMQYSTVVNHIRNGNLSFWDFTNGFGTSMYQLNLLNPSLWLLYLIGIIAGPQVMAHFLIWLHMLLLILAGWMAWKFLSCFSFSFEAKLIASYLYAFNGFLTVWGQHYQFSMMMVYLPLLLCLLERSLQKRRFSPAVVICTACMLLCTYYLSYMVLIVCAMYVPLRLFQTRRDGLKGFILPLLGHGFALLLGVFMGILNLLPSYALVFSVSARMEGQSSLIARCLSALRPWPDLDYFKTLIFRFLSSTLEGIGTSQLGYSGFANFYEAPNLFFSGLLVILLVQFLLAIFFKKGTGIRTRLVQLFALLAGACSLCIMLGSMVFNAFSSPFCRHTFLLMPLFALLTAYMLDVILQEHFFSIIGALLSVVPAVYIYVTKARAAFLLTFRLNAEILAVTIVLMAIFLFLLSRRSLEKWKGLFYVLLCLTIGLNVTADTYTTAGKRDSYQVDPEYTENMYGEDWQELTGYLLDKDADFYRLEKDYTAGSACMDSAGQYYRGISTYNSTSNRYILEFLDKAAPELYYVNGAHWSFRQITDEMDYAELFGIKYVVSQSRLAPAPCYELEKVFGDLYLYRNKNWKSFASFYTKTLAAYDFENHEALLNTDALLKDYLLLDDEAPGVDVNTLSDALSAYELQETDELGITPDLVPDEKGAYTWQQQETLLPLNRAVTEEDGEITVRFTVTVNGSYDLQIRTTEDLYNYKTVTVTADVPTTVSMELPAGTTGLYIHNWNPDLITSLADFHFYSAPAAKNAPSAAEIMVTDTYNDSHLLCSAEVKKEGYLFFPIPYETGWTITANGEEQEILRADYGFSAIHLKPGSYEISLNYRQPLLNTALLITAGSWLFFLVLVLLHHCLNRRKERPTEE
ncbi:MAG: YfhO family protein [Lachnospiraceae bacterium]|nr:YfhO family protein [Lachnospiraceae bacterium]